MSACPEFSVTFMISPEELVARARRAVTEAGGTFEGNTEKGSFKVPTPFGPVTGTYRISASKVYILVTEKPCLLLCWAIEIFIRQSIPTLEMVSLAEAGPACEFRFEFKGSAQDLVAKARKLIEGNGGTFRGDTSNGTFEVRGVRGRYRIEGQTLIVYVDEKPWILPCWVIEKIIKDNLS